MTEQPTEASGIERDRRLLSEARSKGRLATLGAFVRLSGPGWLQSAITLGGGSLASSLYLGVLGGFALLWLQPLAMVLGIVMLSAIGYVTLSTGERPLRAINQHVNPVLGWSWLIATMMANCVWSLPQFSLACGAMRQNLLPNVLGPGQMPVNTANGIVAGIITVICIAMVFSYDSGGKGVAIFGILLKLMVATVVLSFFGVVVYMTTRGALDWGAIGHGLMPDIRLLWTPAATFADSLSAVGSQFHQFWTDKIVNEQQDVLVAAAATAVGINMTFLLPYSMLKRGWNKTFRGLAVFDLSTGLFIPFILATGCVVIASASRFHTKPAVPFSDEDAALAITAEAGTPSFASLDAAAKTSRIRELVAGAYKGGLKEDAKETFPTIAAKAVADAMSREGFAQLGVPERRAAIGRALVTASEGSLKDADTKLVGGYMKIALARMSKEMGGDKVKELKKALDAPTEALKEAKKTRDPEQIKAATKVFVNAQLKLVESLPLADRKIAAMLVRRDSLHLAAALAPLTGGVVAHYVFGIGVVGMAVSSIIILMLINGFCVTEMFGLESKGWPYRIGCLMPAVGILGPFIWSGAAPFLAIPTSVFAFILIPIAYTAFMLLLNQKSLLGENMPKGALRGIWNIVMMFTVVIVGIGSVYKVWDKAGWYGIAAVIAFVLLVLIVQVARAGRKKQLQV